MMRKLVMPKLGLTMTEGVIAEWSIQPGTAFKTDDPVLVVETDKVANEIPAEADGVLKEILVQAGQTVPVGEVIALWDDGASGHDEKQDGVNRTSSQPLAAMDSPAVAGSRPQFAAAAAVALQEPDQSRQRILATPLARRLAGMEKIDLSLVEGTGPRHAVRAQDVRNFVQTNRAIQPVQAAATALEPGVRIKPTLVQGAMARRLTAVKQQIPHFYLSVEANVSRLLALREELNGLNQGMRFTVNHFIVAAVGRALADQPETNAVWVDGEILRYHHSDVGIAVNSEKGLFVPVARNAGALSLTGLARQANRLVERARVGSLTSQEMQGGAVTVSNAGMFNVKFMTPIINPGQAMILGVGSITQQFRPDSKGHPALTKEMGLVLAADHRLLDGVSGLRFLNRVQFYLEQPLNLLLGESGPAKGDG